MRAFLLVIGAISIGLADAFNQTLFKDAEPLEERIVGGSSASRHEFPYQVSIKVNGQHTCGGSIIAPQWIVTAGHCIVGSAYSMRVYSGMLHQNENHPDVQVSAVRQIIVHPSYPGGVAPNDIALLQLASLLRWTVAVRPIRLPKQNQEFGGLGWVSGWGYLSSYNPTTPRTLQKVQLGIWSFNACANQLINLLGSYHPLDDSMLCVGGTYTGRETVCQGDSGGPLMQNNVLLGVTSWTLTPCGKYGAPSVYTKVSHFVSWIKQYVAV